MGRQGAGHRSGRQPRDPDPGLTAAPHQDEGRLDELLRALAHPARRALIRACVDRARPAGELVAVAGLAAASVSEHLKVLRKTGLLVLEPRGRQRFYRTDTDTVREAVQALEAALRR